MKDLEKYDFNMAEPIKLFKDIVGRNKFDKVINNYSIKNNRFNLNKIK